MSGINLFSFEVILGTIFLIGAIIGTAYELIEAKWNRQRKKNQR